MRETKKEVKSEIAIVMVRGIRSKRAIPATKKIGRKTTTVVIVEARMGIATSRAASRIASQRRGVVLRWR